MTAPAVVAPSRETGARPRATCVVVAFHRPDSLARLLASLRVAELDIVVVNVEDDRAVASVAADVAIVPVTRNIGYAAAVNLGAGHAAAPNVVFMNDDVVVSAASVLALVDALDAGADVAVPRIEDEAGRVLRTIAAAPTPSSLAREWLLLPDRPVRGLRWMRVEKWREPAGPEQVAAASATVVAVRRSLLRATPLPEDYFLYWEESEWFWRLARTGAIVEYRPEARCRHAGGRGEVRRDKSRLLARNAVRCVRRTQGRWSALLAYVVVVAWNVRLALVDSVRRVLPGHVGDPAGRARARWAGVGAALVSIREVR